MNVELAKQIIGFEPDALALMQNYRWPQNRAQFKRILRQLVIMTDTPYIHANNVQMLLAQGNTLITTNCTVTPGVMLDINRPLEEITRDIIRQVLYETGGNQSAAAKKLEISRTVSHKSSHLI